MAKVAFLVSKTTATFHLEDGTSGTIPLTHPKFPEVAKLMALDDLDEDEIELLLSLIDTGRAVKAALAQLAEGDLTFTGDSVLFRGQPLNMEACRRIVEIARNGAPIERFMKFLNKVLDNPIESARNELWQFMEASGLPINEDGDFVAYKIVNKNYTDIYSGKFDNSIGKVCQVKPFEVDPDRTRTCSTGLHVCGKDYLPHYGSVGGSSRVIIVVVNPAHVVAVPVDYKFHKMRTWQYKVVGEITDLAAVGLLESRGVVNTADINNLNDIDNEGWQSYDAAADWGNGTGDDDLTDDTDGEGYNEDGDKIAPVDAKANLFVKDMFLDQYYPASVRDLLDGEPLFVYNDEDGEYQPIK